MSHDLDLSPPWPASAPRCRTIAFTSGKGGVGKSNLVLNVGLLLARRGKRVTILDGDLGLASLTVLLGRPARHDLRHVLSGERSLEDILLRGPEGVTVIPAASGVADLASLDPEDRERLLAPILEHDGGGDFLLIDTGAGISDTVLDLVTASDEAVVVTRPEPTALTDAYALMKVVIQHDATFPFHLLINMVRDAEQGQQVFRSLSAILLRFLGYQPGYAGHVVTDPCVEQAVVQQVPFALSSPRAPASRCLDALTDRLVGTAAAADRAPRTFWERVTTGRFRRG